MKLDGKFLKYLAPIVAIAALIGCGESHQPQEVLRRASEVSCSGNRWVVGANHYDHKKNVSEIVLHHPDMAWKRIPVPNLTTLIDLKCTEDICYLLVATDLWGPESIHGYEVNLRSSEPPKKIFTYGRPPYSKTDFEGSCGVMPCVRDGMSLYRINTENSELELLNDETEKVLARHYSITTEEVAEKRKKITIRRNDDEQTHERVVHAHTMYVPQQVGDRVVIRYKVRRWWDAYYYVETFIDGEWTKIKLSSHELDDFDLCGENKLLVLGQDGALFSVPFDSES